MRLTKPRRLAWLGLTIPALMAGGLTVASASHGAPAAAPSAAPAVHMSPQTRCDKLPGMRFRARRDVWGHKGKLIGHVSLYAMNPYISRPIVCLIMWRNGVARGVPGNTRVHWTYRGRTDSRVARSGVRSPSVADTIDRPLVWWGSLRYKGVVYTTKQARIRPGDIR